MSDMFLLSIRHQAGDEKKTQKIKEELDTNLVKGIKKCCKRRHVLYIYALRIFSWTK